jgi:hypothetical protein
VALFGHAAISELSLVLRVNITACHALAGRMEQARDAADRLRKLDPAFRISKLHGWIPIRRPEHRASLANGLRLAGLPE